MRTSSMLVLLFFIFYSTSVLGDPARCFEGMVINGNCASIQLEVIATDDPFVVEIDHANTGDSRAAFSLTFGECNVTCAIATNEGYTCQERNGHGDFALPTQVRVYENQVVLHENIAKKQATIPCNSALERNTDLYRTPLFLDMIRKDKALTFTVKNATELRPWTGPPRTTAASMSESVESSDVGMIVGVSVGGFLIVLVLIIIIVCLVLSSCRKEKTQEVIVQPEVKVQETEQTSISVKSSPPKPKPKPKKKKKQKPIEKTRSEQTFLHGDDLNLVKEDQDRSIHIVGY